MAKILGNEELGLLRTKKFYDQLDNAEDGCQDEMFYRGAKSILDNYNVHQNISHKILKGLCYAYGNNFREHPVNDICDFLYYWLGGILYDNIIPSIRFDSVMPYLFVILRIRNGIKCTAPTYYNISEGENFKNIKLLFDYSKDYDIYDEQITNNNLPCNKNYNEYLQKYVATYKEYEGKCKNVRTSSGYCKAFNEYFHEKNPERLSNLTCNVQNSEPVAERTFGKTKDMQEQHLPAQGMEGKSVTLSEGFQGENEQVAEDGVSSVHPSSQGTSDLINISGPADVPSISTTKTIATTASVAGILVPPFLVYNFTPVRSWINKLLGRNQIYRNPLTERELIENSYQPHHFDSERNRYNISYRPE